MTSINEEHAEMRALVERIVDVVMTHISLPPKYQLRFIRGEVDSGVPLIIMVEHEEKFVTMYGNPFEKNEVKNDLY